MFDKFRRPKRPEPDKSPTPLEPGNHRPQEWWPWPNIDRPDVQLVQSRAAFHEAGHAVVAHYFGIKVERLSIRLRLGSLGRVVPAVATPARLRAMRCDRLRRLADERADAPIRIPADRSRPRGLFDAEDSLHAELHAALAGGVGEEIRFGSSPGCQTDMRIFHLLVSGSYGNVSQFVPGSTIAFLRYRYWISCQQILARPEIWGWLTAVAAASLGSQHGVLTGDEIDQLGPPRPLPPIPPVPLAKVA